jgi:hypothetical protein
VVPPRLSFQKNHGLGLFLTCAVTAIVTGAIVVAYDFYFGGAGGKPASPTLVQEGTLTLRHDPVDVFYPQRYASPPNLSIQGTELARQNCVILEQKQDRFKVHVDNPSVSVVEISWRAEGVPARD